MIVLYYKQLFKCSAQNKVENILYSFCTVIVTVLLVCPGWPPDVSVCRAHGLLFVGAMCSHVDCLSPPILLLNHCFSGSSCVSLVSLPI